LGRVALGRNNKDRHCEEALRRNDQEHRVLVQVLISTDAMPSRRRSTGNETVAEEYGNAARRLSRAVDNGPVLATRRPDCNSRAPAPQPALEERGLSLTDVFERSGLTRAAVSRLENGWNANPTLDTLFRYAAPLGAHVSLSASIIAESLGPES
jgi:hypothetical protein